MTARPIRRNAQTPDRNGKIFYTSTTSLSHISKQTGNVVYHVIKNQMEFGLCYSFLFVSKHKDEWKIDRNDIHEGCPFVYVKNVDDEGSSVYGSIGIRPVFGGVLRIE